MINNTSSNTIPHQEKFGKELFGSLTNEAAIAPPNAMIHDIKAIDIVEIANGSVEMFEN